MQNVTGQTGQPGVVHSWPCGGDDDSDDRDLWATYWFGDLGGSATMSFGTYFFGFPTGDITDDQFYYDLATLVNQFAGFDRGDMNGNGEIDLADIVALWNMVNNGGAGPLFLHMADVNADGNVDNGDVLYLANYYFCLGDAPVGDWAMPDICP
jgi:hypothetical protein